jgi:hypothetical protein
MIGYVHLKQPESLLQLATQIGVASGKTRIRPNGKVEAEFVCISKGYYSQKVWLTRDQIY